MADNRSGDAGPAKRHRFGRTGEGGSGSRSAGADPAGGAERQYHRRRYPNGIHDTKGRRSAIAARGPMPPHRSAGMTGPEGT